MATEVQAIGKYIRVSPYKLRSVVDSIRGKTVEEASYLLQFSQKGVAKHILKVLDSAVANAEHKEDINARPEELKISSVYIDEGPTLKRIEFRAMGRVNRIKKRTSHIVLKLKQIEGIELKESKKEKKEKGKTKKIKKEKAKEKDIKAKKQKQTEKKVKKEVKDKEGAQRGSKS